MPLILFSSVFLFCLTFVHLNIWPIFSKIQEVQNCVFKLLQFCNKLVFSVLPKWAHKLVFKWQWSHLCGDDTARPVRVCFQTNWGNVTVGKRFHRTNSLSIKGCEVSTWQKGSLEGLLFLYKLTREMKSLATVCLLTAWEICHLPAGGGVWKPAGKLTYFWSLWVQFS